MQDGKLRSVEAVIDAKGQAVNVTVRDKGFGGPPVSGGSTEDVFEPKVNDGKTISGRPFRKSPGSSFDDVPYTYDATFSAPVVPRAKKQGARGFRGARPRPRSDRGWDEAFRTSSCGTTSSLGAGRGTLRSGIFITEEAHMRRVTGIGGIFFKAKDPAALRAWYKQHLGIDVQDWGGAAFPWTDAEGKPVSGTTAWNVTASDSDYFAPSTSQFMVNYRVADLHTLVAALRDEGCNVLGKIEESEFGRFGWVLDPEGNKIELWEPPPGQ